VGHSKLLASSLAVVAAAGAAAWPASGQCRLCETPSTTRPDERDSDRVTLEIETSLNFDRLVLYGEGDGSAVIRPDGSSSAHGSVTEVSPRAMVGSAMVRGEPGRAVRVEIPTRIVLRSFGGGELVFEDVVSDLPSLPRLDSAGRLAFRFGGRLHVRGDSEGEYEGDLPITVEYL
jgi:Domain of unknown function (DUF4402)